MQDKQILEKLIEAAAPFAEHNWYDAEMEDDDCKLTRHSGGITVGHWRFLRLAIQEARAALPIPRDTENHNG